MSYFKCRCKKEPSPPRGPLRKIACNGGGQLQRLPFTHRWMNLLYKEYIISKELVFCSFGFHLEDKSGKMKGMGFTELQLQLSGIGEWETDERKRSSVSSSKWRAARKSHLRFNVHVQSLFYFASYRCRSAAFFAVNRQGNNWWAIRD